MNSRVSVDAESEHGGAASDGGEDLQQDSEAGPSLSHDGHGGSVVLVLPSKDDMIADPSTADEALPVMVNGVPVYISHTSTGSPLYIRQYPPTLEEIMTASPEDRATNFDGFSDASAQTFEGFSEGSCSSVLFEGFSEDALQNAKFSLVDSLGRLVREEYDRPVLDDWDDYDYDEDDLVASPQSPQKKKSAARNSRKSSGKSGKGKDTAGRSKRSSSSDTPAHKKVKQEGVTVYRSAARKGSYPAMTTSLSASKRRQSADKQEKKPPEIVMDGKKPRKLLSPENPNYIGEHCNEIGCTVSFLERMAIKDVKVCNGVVLELCDFASRISWAKDYVVRWIQRLNGKKTDEPLEEGDLRSLQGVVKRRKALATIHSGNPNLKAKLKSFDFIEFILPSTAKRLQTTADNNPMKSPKATQGIKVEIPSMIKQESGLIDKPDMNSLLNTDVKNDNEPVPETKTGQVTPQIEEQGASRRGVKRSAHATENENKRCVKEKGIINIENEQEEKPGDKIEENSNKDENEANKTCKEIVKSKKNENRQTSTTTNQKKVQKTSEDKKSKEVNQPEVPKTVGRIGTRRASMMLAGEKEKQAIGNEETEQIKRDRKDNRRASIAPKLKEEHDDSTGTTKTSDKKKGQVITKEQKIQDKQDKQTHAIQSHEVKENTDPRKERKITCEEREIQVIQGEKGEEKSADKTEKETKAEKRRVSSRRASMLLAKEDKERLPTDRPETNQTVQRIKREASGDRRSSSGTSNRIKLEEEQGLTHKADKTNKDKPDKTHDKEAKETKTGKDNEKATEKESQGGREIKVENKIGTRRTSAKARQEKEKQSTELDATNQGNDKTDEECRKSERIGCRKDKESGRKEDKKQEKKKDSSKEIKSQTALEGEKGIARDKSDSSPVNKQEGEEEITDKETEEDIILKEEEIENTDDQVKQAVVKLEKVAKRDTRTSSRRASGGKTKLEEDASELKEAGRSKGNRTTSMRAKSKQVGEDQKQEEGDEKREKKVHAKEKGLKTTDKQESTDQETAQTVDKTGNSIKKNRTSGSRRGSMITNEVRDKGEETAREAKNVKTSKQKIKDEEQEATDQAKDEESTGKIRRLGSVKEKRTAAGDQNKRVGDEETQSDDDGFGKDKHSKSANKEKHNRMENEKKGDKSISTEEGKEGKRSPKDSVNESEDKNCEENQVVPKRNKVIIRDKRISRWQNKKMIKYEDKTNIKKEEPDLVVEDSPKSLEPRQHLTGERTSNKDSHSDDSDDDNLVIDEGDSMHSEGSEDPLHMEKSDTSMQSDPSSTPRKKRMVVSGSEVKKGQMRQKVHDATEDPLAGKVMDSPEDFIKINEEIMSDEDTTQGHALRKIDEESSKNQDPGSKETSAQDATSPAKGETKVTPQGTKSSYDGTLGVSKSGRLRKASAKGIQSIEIKCLFMHRNNEAKRPPPPLPDLKNEQTDKDWMQQEKKSPVKQDRRDKDSAQERKLPKKHDSRGKDGTHSRGKEGTLSRGKEGTHSRGKEGTHSRGKEGTHSRGKEGTHSSGKEGTPQKKSPTDPLLIKNPRTRKQGNEYLSYSAQEGHFMPNFKETNYYLGDYCCKAGITVRDLNSDVVKKVRMTHGMIKELHDFYKTRGASKTSLAIRLFKLNGRKILDNTHLLSTVIRITSLGALKQSDKERLGKEFLLPNRITYCGPPEGDEATGKTQEQNVMVEAPQTSPGEGLTPQNRLRSIRKRCVKPEDSGDEEFYDYGDGEEDEDLSSEILLTCGEEGSITRGDIVHLYAQWLRNKMSLGSNTFVTDLLHSVEQLMAERHVTPIRIPAGTLMSSSVRLHDEYKQILKISKEDGVMYLQEDWLEDIRYLLSISVPSRRNTTEGEGNPGGSAEADTATPSDKPAKDKTTRPHSDGLEEETNRHHSLKEEEINRHRSLKEEEINRHHSLKEETNRHHSLKEEEINRRHSLKEEETNRRRSLKEEEIMRRRSGGLKEEDSDYEGDSDYAGASPSNALHSKTTPKGEVSRSHQMESVGKRRKRKNVRQSLQEFEREILQELETHGGLEEEEEDVLSQLDREEGISESEEEEVVENKKKPRYEKKPEKDMDKDVQKKIKAIPESVRGVEESDFEVQKIVDYQEIHDKKGKHVRYLVRWIGFGPEDDSWVNEQNLQCPSILEAFWKRNKKPEEKPCKPQPEKVRKSPKQTKPGQPSTPNKQQPNNQQPNNQQTPNSPKEDEQSIIQAMVKYDSTQQGGTGNKKSAIVTKRELLTLYDSWRQDNQNELIAGSSNTVNVEVLKGRVKALMASRKVMFHPESLLNACFMMTLMKTRLQSKMAIDRFLNTSCSEVLESSHRQYLKRKFSQIVVPSSKYSKDQMHTVLSLQNELQSLKLDLTTAQKWRAVKNSQLGAVEEEVNYLETAMDIPDMKKKTKKVMYFKQELQKLKKDIKLLDNHQMHNLNGGNGKSSEIPLFNDIGSDQESYRKSCKIVRNKLTTMNMAKTTVNTIMEVVARRAATQLGPQ